MKRLITAALLAILALLLPTLVNADSIGGQGQGSSVCLGGQAQWTGTRTKATTYTINSAADIHCYTPQVNVTTGDTAHSMSSDNPKPTGPCSATAKSHITIGPLLPDGNRSVSYWNPNTQAIWSFEISDTGAQDSQTGFNFDPGQEPLLWSSWWMGRYSGSLKWQTVNATWVDGVCTGGWTTALQPTCGYFGIGIQQCSLVANVLTNGPLPFVPPPTVTVAPLLSQAEAQVKQDLSGGQVTSEFASGSVSPKHGLIVRVPTCFWTQGAALNTTKSFGLIDPQPGAGAALVVNYVATVSEDRTWWDFGDGSTATQPGVDPTQPCAVTHTYYHVSADAYGSQHNHTSPPGQTYPFTDAEPGPDQEAVVVWHHVHFSLTAYYVQPDGSQFQVPIPGTGGNDFWVPSQPEWVKVQQIESVPYVCPCPGAY